MNSSDKINGINLDIQKIEKELEEDKKETKQKLTTTKKVMTIILSIAIIDLQLTYLLAFLGRTEIAETLAVSIVTEIIAVFLGYCCKSYFETKELEKNKITWKQLENNVTETTDNEEEVKG